MWSEECEKLLQLVQMNVWNVNHLKACEGFNPGRKVAPARFVLSEVELVEICIKFDETWESPRHHPDEVVESGAVSQTADLRAIHLWLQ